jgi:hypothetical protein
VWYDVSTDRTDVAPISDLEGLAGHVLDPADTIVPGDTWAVAYKFHVNLVGENLVAALTATEAAAIQDNFTSGNLTVSAQVYKDGVAFGAPVTYSGTATDVGYFTPEGGADANQNGVVALGTGGSDITVVVTVSFADTAGQATAADMEAIKQLGDITFELTQVRSGSGAGLFTP